HPVLRQHRLKRSPLPHGHRSLRPSFSCSSLSPWTTRRPRLTWVSLRIPSTSLGHDLESRACRRRTRGAWYTSSGRVGSVRGWTRGWEPWHNCRRWTALVRSETPKAPMRFGASDALQHGMRHQQGDSTCDLFRGGASCHLGGRRLTPPDGYGYSLGD